MLRRWHDVAMPGAPEIVYGDPCRECGFEWSTPIEELIEAVGTFPQSFADALAGTDGTGRHPALTWSAKAYVVGVVLQHPERGTRTVDAIVRSNAHDGLHHLWDVRRIVS